MFKPKKEGYINIEVLDASAAVCALPSCEPAPQRHAGRELLLSLQLECPAQPDTGWAAQTA